MDSENKIYQIPEFTGEHMPLSKKQAKTENSNKNQGLIVISSYSSQRTV